MTRDQSSYAVTPPTATSVAIESPVSWARLPDRGGGSATGASGEDPRPPERRTHHSRLGHRCCSRVMKFEVTYVLHPSSRFGLPEEDFTVYPAKWSAKMGEIVLATIDPQTLRPTYAVLSRYREPEDSVNVDLVLPGATATVRDNNLVLTLQATDFPSAQMAARKVMDALLARLSLTTGIPFHREVLKFSSADGRLMPGLGKWSIHAVAFNTEELTAQIRQAEALSNISEPALERALAYFQHASLLLYRRETILDEFESQGGLLLASVFLNLWKAITAVIGEPGAGDSPEKRCETIGLPADFYRTQIRPIARARHTYDVAHYSLDPEAIKKAELAFRDGAGVARTVLSAYADYLRKGGAPFANLPESERA